MWDVLVEPRVLEAQYFYLMVRHQASHDVPVVAARLLQGFIEENKLTPHCWLEPNSTIRPVTMFPTELPSTNQLLLGTHSLIDLVQQPLAATRNSI